MAADRKGNQENSRLSARQEQAATLLAVGRSVAAAARECQLNDATIWGWLKHQPAFKERIAELSKAATERAINRLADMMAGPAADALLARLTATDPKTGKPTATLEDIKAAFELFIQTTNNADLKTQIEELRRSLSK